MYYVYNKMGILHLNKYHRINELTFERQCYSTW